MVVHSIYAVCLVKTSSADRVNSVIELYGPQTEGVRLALTRQLRPLVFKTSSSSSRIPSSDNKLFGVLRFELRISYSQSKRDEPDYAIPRLILFYLMDPTGLEPAKTFRMQTGRSPN